MAKITVNQSEERAIATAIVWLENDAVGDAKAVKGLKSLQDKIEKAKAKAAVSECIGVAKILEMARAALGDRLRLHPNPNPTWYSITHNRLKVNGITEEIAARALANIATSWKGEIFIDTLVNSLAKYSVMPIGKQQVKTISKGWLEEV